MAVAADGTVYVTDSGNHRVQRFTADGEPLGAWGSGGTLDGQFSMPTGIAVVPDGSVYVADEHNNRIQRFAADGDFLGKWGERADAADWLGYDMQDIAVGPEGHILVTQSRLVYVFDAAGRGLCRWSAQSSSQSTQQALAVAPDNVVYVADGLEVRMFTLAGDYLGGWEHKSTQLAVAPDGTLYMLTDSGVQHLSATGEILGQWGSPGVGDGQFSDPVAIALGPDDAVYVLDGRRVQRFTTAGDFRGSWQPPMFELKSIAVAPDGTLYVAGGVLDSFLRPALLRYTPAGEPLGRWKRETGTGCGSGYTQILPLGRMAGWL